MGDTRDLEKYVRERNHKGRFVATALEDRFLANVYKTDGCWFWVGGIHRSGYGNIPKGEAYRGAHIVAYQLYKGEITSGLDVLHSCDIRQCVNPDHLFLGTAKDNISDWMSKTGCCNKGHELSDVNVSIRKDGRICLACERIRTARYRKLHPRWSKAS